MLGCARTLALPASAMSAASRRDLPERQRAATRPSTARTRSRTLLPAVLLLAIDIASGVLPRHANIDAESVANLLSGHDICGDAEHRSSCLKIMPCDELDKRLGSSPGDPVWTPDLSLPAKKGKAHAFRNVLPTPAGKHPKEGSLPVMKTRTVDADAFFKFPRARILYRSSASKIAATCDAAWCLIPDGIRVMSKPGTAVPSSKGKVCCRPIHPSAARHRSACTSLLHGHAHASHVRLTTHRTASSCTAGLRGAVRSEQGGRRRRARPLHVRHPHPLLLAAQCTFCIEVFSVYSSLELVSQALIVTKGENYKPGRAVGVGEFSLPAIATRPGSI